MANTTYYRDMLKKNKTKMSQLHSTWEGISKNRATPEHGKCSIRSVLGQTQLLIAKKFDFMDTFLNKADEQKDLNVNNEDLQGLWDVICIEVEDLNKKYKDLEISVRNGWRRPTGTKKQTSSKPHEKTPATTQRVVVAKPTLKRSLSRSLSNDTPFGSPKSSFTMSRPTAAPSTSSSAKVDSAPAPSMIRSKAVAKNPFSGLVKAPILLISDTDDSDDEYYDALSS